jgi:hypothetical protein
MEVTVTATPINHRLTHRPGQVLAAAAAVAAIVAGSVALSLSLHDSAPGPQPATTIAHHHSHTFPNALNGLPPRPVPSRHDQGFTPTISGGRVMVGP